MKKSYFSLIELLVVIAIIAVLAGLLLPSIMSSQEKARRTKAKADMNSLKIALKAVESTYGKMADYAGTFGSGGSAESSPSGVSGAVALGYGDDDKREDETSNSSRKAYQHLIKELSAPDQFTTAQLNINKRKIKFLDQREDGWLDPWERPYIILLNNDFTGKITLNGKDYYSEVLIYSRGPNMKNDQGKNSNNSDEDGVDDICGWESN